MEINNDKIQIPVIKGIVLGVSVYRGYSPLNILSIISKPDIYDASKNPTGTQRDLSPKHAKDAYEYVKNRAFAFWPEVFLCVRSNDVIEYAPSSMPEFGTLTINLDKIRGSKKILISRVDGNHRLHLADGCIEGYDAINKTVSFCITDMLSLEEEITLFRDINNNQKRMNTSHLDKIEVRLNEDDILKKKDPALYIAHFLGKDKTSPFYSKIYEGGKKGSTSNIPLRLVKTGISYMFSRPTRLNALKDPDAQYKIIKNFFNAVKEWFPNAWAEPEKYIMLRGVGLWAICFIGAEVIDRVLSNGNYDTKSMLKILNSGKKWNWSNKGDFEGYSGRGGAVKIRDKVTAEFVDETGYSINELYKKIMKE